MNTRLRNSADTEITNQQLCKMGVELKQKLLDAGCFAHEAGHGAITRRRWLVVTVGQYINPDQRTIHHIF